MCTVKKKGERGSVYSMHCALQQSPGRLGDLERDGDVLCIALDSVAPDR